MLPADGGVKREARRKSVDLPQPDGPTMATISPDRTCSETSSRACVPSGKTLETCSKVSARAVLALSGSRPLTSEVVRAAGRPSTPTGYPRANPAVIVTSARAFNAVVAHALTRTYIVARP